VCRDYIRAVADRNAKFQAQLAAAKVSLRIVGPGAAKWIKKYKEDTKFQGLAFTDPDRKVYQAASVKVAAGYGDLVKGSSVYTGSHLSGAMWSAKIGLKEGSESGDNKQLGAVFVLAPDGKCDYHYFETSPADHPIIEEVFRKAGAEIPKSEKEGTDKWADPDKEDE